MHHVCNPQILIQSTGLVAIVEVRVFTYTYTVRAAFFSMSPFHKTFSIIYIIMLIANFVMGFNYFY